MPGRIHRMAAIDVGSNSVHMIVVEPRGRSFRVLDKEKEMVQLARGSFGGGPLTEEAINRGVASLVRMAEIARRWDATDIVAVATAAVREAPNGSEFIRRAETASAIRVNVISGEQEADLIYRAVRRTVDFHAGKALCVDIGGGSIELVIGTDHDVYFAHSAPLGGIRLAEKFFASDPPTPSEVTALRKLVRKTLRKPLFKISSIGFDFCIGSSGTINTLAGLCEPTPGEKEVASGLRWLDEVKLERVLSDLLGMTAQQRVDVYGIDPKRAETILSGGFALLEIMIALTIPNLRASTAAMREGIVDYWFESRNVNQEREGGVQRSAVIDLAEQSGWDGTHERHVATLALRIFDQVADLHGLEGEARDLLEYAALLHKVGMHVTFKSHHKHSYYLIRHSGLHGFTTGQVMILANVARYYRKAIPSLEHENYQELSEEQRVVVDYLSSILRIAAGLDRGRRQAVEDVHLEIGRRVVRFEVTPRLDASLEIESARRRARLFEQIFGRKVTVDAR